MLTRTNVALSLVVAGLGACATDSSIDSTDLADPTETAASALSPEQIAALRAPISDDAKAEQDRAFVARVDQHAIRAQAYLEQHVIPDFDRALRATANVDYATLKAEAVAAITAGDAEATKAGLDRFYAAHGDQIDAAFASMGTTAVAVANQIREAAIAGDTVAPPEQHPHNRGKCIGGWQLGPTPPFADAGWFSNGINWNPQSVSQSGAITASAATNWGWASGGGWVRADNIPPVAAGFTSVTVQANFTTMMAEELLWAPGYSAAGVGLTIEMRDGGAQGPLIGSCRAALLDNNLLPIGGYQKRDTPQPVLFQCTLHHNATPYLSTKVIVDAYATQIAAYTGFADATAVAQVTSIQHVTCVD